MRSLEFRSHRLAEAEEFLSWAYAPIRLGNHGHAVGVQVERISSDGLSVDRLDVDSTLSYDAAALGRVCLITVHHGAVVDTTEGRRVVHGPGETFLLAQPDRPCTGELCAARCTVTLFDPGLLDQVAEGTVPSGGPVRFTGQRPVDAAANRSLGATVSFLRDHVLAGPDGNSLVVETAVRHLAAVALSALPNTTMDDGLGWPGNHDAGPETLRRAMAFIENNAHRDIGLADIAAAVFVTPRAVQYAFSRHADTTPLGYLRRVRLFHAHTDLVAATPHGASVIAIAARWGFNHQGRFAAAYRAAYGVSPSATLRAGPDQTAESLKPISPPLTARAGIPGSGPP
ncbi:helix-turn-helix domain-containing protein [Streptomyces zhihengii]